MRNFILFNALTNRHRIRERYFFFHCASVFVEELNPAETLTDRTKIQLEIISSIFVIFRIPSFYYFGFLYDWFYRYYSTFFSEYIKQSEKFNYKFFNEKFCNETDSCYFGI